MLVRENSCPKDGLLDLPKVCVCVCVCLLKLLILSASNASARGMTGLTQTTPSGCPSQRPRIKKSCHELKGCLLCGCMLVEYAQDPTAVLECPTHKWM